MGNDSVLELIASETVGKSFKTTKFGFDGIDIPRLDYDDSKKIEWKAYGENEAITEVRDLSSEAKRRESHTPCFSFFLDGSRKVYKVDDLSYKNQVFPLLAGQVGVGCCERKNKTMRPVYVNGNNLFERHFVISLPSIAKSDDFIPDELAFEHLRERINSIESIKQRGIYFAKILTYDTAVDPEGKIENKGIATIQDYMVEQEKLLVAKMVKLNLLNEENFLLKDGTLEYRVQNITDEKELAKFKNNYQFVVGVSKSFNPTLCIDKRNNNISKKIAQLPLYSRTPVNLYRSDRIGDMFFAIWFVRIRDKKYSKNAFDGVLKIEKIVEGDSPLDTSQVDFITANIINERNPVCYGSDSRWANHLYPVFVTESYVKSQYLSDSMFLNLFN